MSCSAAAEHTTTALVVNESEPRLLADIERFFLELAPADRPWLHNDLHLRPGAWGWAPARRCCWWSWMARANGRCCCS